MPRITASISVHLEGDVIEQRIARLGVGDGVVDAVAADEVHEPGAIGELEPEHIDREALCTLPVLGVEHDVRHLHRPVAVGSQRLRALFLGEEAEHVPFGTLDEKAGAAPGSSKSRMGPSGTPAAAARLRILWTSGLDPEKVTAATAGVLAG